MRVSGRRAGTVAVVVGATLVLAYWISFARERQLRSEWGAVLQHTQRPFILNGMVLPLHRFVTPTMTWGRNHDSYLVVVSSDQCPACRAQLPRWLSLMAQLPGVAGWQLLIVTKNGAEIPRALSSAASQRGLRSQIVRVTNNAGFSEQTGIAWTPQVLVLDSTGRVRISAEAVTHTVEAAIIEYALSLDLRHRPPLNVRR